VSSYQLAIAPPNGALGRQGVLDLGVLDHVRMRAWDRLLFVECADGWLVEEAWRRLGKGCVCGLSKSPELVDLAVRMRGVPGRVEFKRWDGGRFPLAYPSFDRVISCVPCGRYLEPVAVLREIARVLRPDGDAYLLESDDAAPRVPRALGVADLERLLLEAGFGDVQRNGGDAAPTGRWVRAITVVLHARNCSART